LALLSRMIRTAAITGRTDTISAWFGGRQGGRWAEQTVRAALPTTGGRGREPGASPETLRELSDLRERGVLTDGEFETLSRDLGG
jgi:hypothetical protein